MSKVFLSHSSKQKFYVEIVANKLGKFNVVYDAWTFEIGNKTLDEIYKGIVSSGIFVLFISNEALESDWVRKEINQAEEYLRKGKLKRFLPLIIDSTVKHNDPRIPQWIRDEYNLRYISKPTKSYDLIVQSLRLVYWDLYPKKKELDQLFIGRTNQIRHFEERIYDFDKPFPVSIIVSGLTSIGRRKFLKHVLVKSNKIGEQYSPPIISVDNRSSIEDLIIRLYGLGYSQKENDFVRNLSDKTIHEKILIASELLNELFKNNDVLFVLDNFCIVNRAGYIAEWFLPIIDNIKRNKGLTICLISQSRTRAKQIMHNDFVFTIEIPELESYERKALFSALLENAQLEINMEDFKLISNQFKGFPEQISYTTSLILTEGIKYVTNNPHEIIEYNSEKVAKLVRKFDGEIARQILKILSESEFLSFNMLEKILGDDFSTAKEVLSQLSNEFILEYVGNTKEFVRLNDSVKDYIQRIGYKLSEKYNNNLQNHAKNAFSDYDIIDRDISDYVISFKESLKNGYEIPKEFLIPSHYVNAMRELYNYERRYKDVITLAERILQKEQFLDKRIVKEIRYWFCLSLARRRDNRILKEVQEISGADHNFLLGFYYRIIGRHEEAISRLKQVISESPNFYRAKRELVQVYLITEQYEEAFTLSRDNYLLDKNNPYNLQSYFRCLIKLDGARSKDELKMLLQDLENNPNIKAREMFMEANAQYTAIVENNIHKAVKIADDAINAFPSNPYPYLSKIDLLHKSGLVHELQDTINIIERKFEEESDIFMKLPYLSSKCFLLCKLGDKNQAFQILNSKIKPNFSKSIYDKVRFEIER